MLGQTTHFVEVLAAGMLITLVVTAGGFLLSVIIGLFLAALQTTNSAVLRSFVYVYVEIFRSLPILTVLFVVYFGLPSVGLLLSPIPAAIIGFGLNGGAVLTEVFRSSILSINYGQTEAAKAIGMRRFMILQTIVVPQAVKMTLPSLTNFAIGLMKDSSLASAVAAPEILFKAKTLVSQTFKSTEIYILVALFYLVVSLPLSQLAKRLERRSGRGRRS